MENILHENTEKNGLYAWMLSRLGRRLDLLNLVDNMSLSFSVLILELMLIWLLKTVKECSGKGTGKTSFEAHVQLPMQILFCKTQRK